MVFKSIGVKNVINSRCDGAFSFGLIGSLLRGFQVDEGGFIGTTHDICRRVGVSQSLKRVTAITNTNRLFRVIARISQHAR